MSTKRHPTTAYEANLNQDLLPHPSSVTLLHTDPLAISNDNITSVQENAREESYLSGILLERNNTSRSLTLSTDTFSPCARREQILKV